MFGFDEFQLGAIIGLMFILYNQDRHTKQLASVYENLQKKIEELECYHERDFWEEP